VIDGYALTYLAFLLLTCLVALKWGHRARIMGAALMTVAWVMTILARPIGAEAPPLSFAAIDFINVVLFCVIGGFYDRTWAICVAGLHIGMLLTHFAFATLLIHNQFLYLSILAALSYVALSMIAVPPLWNRILGRGTRDMDYRDFVHLGYWHSLFGDSEKKTPE